MAHTVGHRGLNRNLYDQYVHTKKETAENEDLDRKGSPVCVYGDMELQERATVEEFMYGPLPKVPGNAVIDKKEEAMSNQILGYLFGKPESDSHHHE